MKVHQIPFDKTNIYSELITDYLNESKDLVSSISSFPNFQSLTNLSNSKSNQFSQKNRDNLIKHFKEQYFDINISKNVKKNIELLSKNNTVTITTGHQLSLMTGPLYFIYKIVSIIKLSALLNKKNKNKNHVPVFWMATEDHDFEEIKSFHFNDKNIIWDQPKSGAVGEISLENLECLKLFIEDELGVSKTSNFIKHTIEETYLSKKNLSDATFHLVNILFSEYGLLVLDANSIKLKKSMIPFFEKELQNHECKKQVDLQTENLKGTYGKKFKPQVNPREINLFYISNGNRSRILKSKKGYELSDSDKTFTKDSILKELRKYPDRFSPNVLMRPLYQEVILPNIAYIGGAGEISYWLQLKGFFESQNITFPALIVRNSALLISSKISKKMNKYNINYIDLFNDKNSFIKKKISEISNINIDLQFLKDKLESQFKYLEKIAKKTDSTFEGAIKAQKSKQFKGIDKLEKRLLKAQKRKYIGHLEQMELIYDNLFPENILQERKKNFFDLYMKFGYNFIPDLIKNFNPLNKEFTVFKF